MTVQSTTYPLGSKASLSKGLGTPIFPLKKPGDIKTYFWGCTSADVRGTHDMTEKLEEPNL